MIVSAVALNGLVDGMGWAPWMDLATYGVVSENRTSSGVTRIMSDGRVWYVHVDLASVHPVSSTSFTHGFSAQRQEPRHKTMRLRRPR